MIATKCPGQDTRYWTADDIHEQECPHCGAEIEFWKTDIRVRCPRCKQKVVNPRFNLGCAAWCAFAEQCLGYTARGQVSKPLRQSLETELGRLMHGLPLQLKEIKAKMEKAASRCGEAQIEPLPVLIALAIVELRRLNLLKDQAEFLKKLTGEHQFPAEAVREGARLAGRKISGDIEELILSITDKKDESEGKQ